MTHILIVEDNTIFRLMVKDLLASRFPLLSISEAADGRAAVREIEVSPPTIILMDIHLPGESGLDLTRSIKASHPEIEVIILTNYDLPEYEEAAYQAGAGDFLSKASCTEKEIAKAIESAASRLQVSPIKRPM